MPPLRLDTLNTCLLIIDVQERLIGEMHEPQRLVERCCFLSRCAGLLELPVAVTEQYVKGLGPTVEPIRDWLPEGTGVFQKTRFSGCVSPVQQWLAEHGRPNILLAGMEAHVCILQTCLDLLAAGKNVFLVSDAISGGEVDQIEPALKRLERAGAIVTGCISTVYELLCDAAHPRFRDCLALVKPLRPASGSKKVP